MVNIIGAREYELSAFGSLLPELHTPFCSAGYIFGKYHSLFLSSFSTCFLLSTFDTTLLVRSTLQLQYYDGYSGC